MALGLVLTPEPNTTYLVSISITQGRRAGFISLLGVGAGFLVYLAAAAAGLETVFLVVPGAYTALKLTGAAYLLYPTWQALRPGGVNAFARVNWPSTRRAACSPWDFHQPCEPEDRRAVRVAAAAVHRPRGAPVALQSLVLGATQIGIALTVDGLIVVLAGSLARLRAVRPTWMRVQRYAMGCVLGGLAVELATDRSRTVAA